MKIFRALMLVFSVFSCVGVLLAHDTQESTFSRGAYENGYVRGYQHGAGDIQAQVNFDYRQGYQNQTGGREDITYDTNESCEARVGYIEGYVDGYFRHQARVQANANFGYSGSNGYERDRSGYSGTQDATVIAFTRKGYSGYSQVFRIGQYPNLQGEMHDNIDSLAVRGNVRVILFDDQNFGGRRVVVDHNTSDLDNFKGKAASMIVESLYDNR